MWTCELKHDFGRQFVEVGDGQFAAELTARECLELFSWLRHLLGRTSPLEFQKELLKLSSHEPGKREFRIANLITVDSDNQDVFVLQVWGKVSWVGGKMWRKSQYRMSRADAENLLENYETVIDAD